MGSGAAPIAAARDTRLSGLFGDPKKVFTPALRQSAA